MENIHLTGKQIISILKFVLFVGVLFNLPDIFRSQIVQSHSLVSDNFDFLKLFYWLILIIGAYYLERRKPSKPYDNDSIKVNVPLWRTILVISLIPLTFLLLALYRFY